MMVVVVMKVCWCEVRGIIVLNICWVDCMLMCCMLCGVGRCMGLVISVMLVFVLVVVRVMVKFILLLLWLVMLCMGLMGLKVGLVVMSSFLLCSGFGVRKVLMLLKIFCGFSMWLSLILL